MREYGSYQSYWLWKEFKNLWKRRREKWSHTSGAVKLFLSLHFLISSSARLWRFCKISTRCPCSDCKARKRPVSGQSLLATTAAKDGLSASPASGCVTSAPKNMHRLLPTNVDGCGRTLKLRPPHFTFTFKSKFVIVIFLWPASKLQNSNIKSQITNWMMFHWNWFM